MALPDCWRWPSASTSEDYSFAGEVGRSGSSIDGPAAQHHCYWHSAFSAALRADEASSSTRPRLRLIDQEAPALVGAPRAVAARDRAVLLDWMLDVAEEFALDGDTIFLAADLLDRHLSVADEDTALLQLLGLACTWVAAKAGELMPPSAHDMISLVDGLYSVSQLLQMEQGLLLSTCSTQQDLCPARPTVHTALQRLLHVSDAEQRWGVPPPPACALCFWEACATRQPTGGDGSSSDNDSVDQAGAGGRARDAAYSSGTLAWLAGAGGSSSGRMDVWARKGSGSSSHTQLSLLMQCCGLGDGDEAIEAGPGGGVGVHHNAPRNQTLELPPPLPGVLNHAFWGSCDVASVLRASSLSGSLMDGLLQPRQAGGSHSAQLVPRGSGGAAVWGSAMSHCGTAWPVTPLRDLAMWATGGNCHDDDDEDDGRDDLALCRLGEQVDQQPQPAWGAQGGAHIAHLPAFATCAGRPGLVLPPQDPAAHAQQLRLTYMVRLLAEACLLEHTLVACAPAEVAAACLMLARAMLGMPAWTPVLAEAAALPGPAAVAGIVVVAADAFQRARTDADLVALQRRYGERRMHVLLEQPTGEALALVAACRQQAHAHPTTPLKPSSVPLRAHTLASYCPVPPDARAEPRVHSESAGGKGREEARVEERSGPPALMQQQACQLAMELHTACHLEDGSRPLQLELSALGVAHLGPSAPQPKRWGHHLHCLPGASQPNTCAPGHGAPHCRAEAPRVGAAAAPTEGQGGWWAACAAPPPGLSMGGGGRRGQHKEWADTPPLFLDSATLCGIMPPRSMNGALAASGMLQVLGSHLACNRLTGAPGSLECLSTTKDATGRTCSALAAAAMDEGPLVLDGGGMAGLLPWQACHSGWLLDGGDVAFPLSMAACCSPVSTLTGTTELSGGGGGLAAAVTCHGAQYSTSPTPTALLHGPTTALWHEVTGAG